MREKIALMVVCFSLGAACPGAAATHWLILDPNSSIQTAIEDACDGDVITVSPGTYVENLRFKGRAITLRSTDPCDPGVVAGTIIDGSDPCDDTFGSVVTFWDQEGRDSVLEGFTLTNGLGKGPGSVRIGGGILCVDAGPTVRNCVITGNDSANITFGAGILCNQATDILFSHCTISHNQSSWAAAGMYCGASTVTMVNCKFIGNRAPAAAAAWVIDCEKFNLRGSQSVFRDNRADGNAGAIMAEQSALSLRHISFLGNVAAGGHGAALFLSGQCSGAVENCTFAGNRGKSSGAMYCEQQSALGVTGCVFVDNEAFGSSTAGGALHCVADSDPTILSTSIIHRNDPQQLRLDGDAGAVTFCNLQDSAGANHNIDVDPCFVLDGYWNDPNLFDVWIEGDYHLKDESLCIDAGDPNYVPARPEQTDIDGEPRYSGLLVDIGIDETRPLQRVYNVTQDLWHSGIDAALAQANDDDELVARPHRYIENIRFYSDSLLRSVFPDNDAMVAATIIDGSSFSQGLMARSTVSIRDADTTGGGIDGFTISGGDGSFSPSGRSGGGIYCSAGTCSITRCTIEGNSAGFGAGMCLTDSSATIEGCIIKHNAALSSGGGVAVLGSANVSFANSAIVANTAPLAGGVHSQGDSLCQIDFCTIKNNDNYGLYADPCTTVLIAHTIFWANDPNDPCDANDIIVDAQASVSMDYTNLPGGWAGGLGNIDQDPVFEGHIADVGPDPNDPNDDIWSWHDYRLLDASPCINAGDPNYPADANDLDLRGQSRRQYCRVDMGAYEADDLYPLGLPGLIHNVNQSTSYCSLTAALEEIEQTQVLIAGPGRYYENIVIDCCDVYLRSTQPSDANTVAATIIDGSQPTDPCRSAVITFAPDRASGVTIAGLTIVGGAGNWSVGGHYSGGGVHCLDNDDITFEQCWLTANEADRGAGGYFNATDDLTLEKCYFAANTGHDGGGVFLTQLRRPAIAYCVFHENRGFGLGAGIHISDCCDVVLQHDLISKNSLAEDGGALFAASVEGLDIDFCTVFGNEAFAGGGGVKAYDTHDLAIANSIFWGNDPDQIDTTEPNGITVSYCDIQAGYPGSDNLDVDPCFVDATANDFHLRPNSHVINRGDPCYNPTQTVLDLGGLDRVAWARVDIGAYECHDPDANHLPGVVHNVTTNKWYRGLSPALAEVTAGQTITLTPGTYADNVTVGPNDVTITSLAPWSSATVGETIIDGSNPTDPDHASVITLSPDSAHGFTLDGVTLSGGSGRRDNNNTPVDPCDDLWYGGGLYSSGVDRLTIRRCRVLDNTADIGGAFFVYDADQIRIENCVIAHNSTDNAAGGVRIAQCASASIAFCTVADNTAGLTGGGVSLVDSAHGTVSHTIIWQNSPDQIYLAANSSLAASYCDVQGGFPVHLNGRALLRQV